MPIPFSLSHNIKLDRGYDESQLKSILRSIQKSLNSIGFQTKESINNGVKFEKTKFNLIQRDYSDLIRSGEVTILNGSNKSAIKIKVFFSIIPIIFFIFISTIAGMIIFNPRFGFFDTVIQNFIVAFIMLFMAYFLGFIYPMHEVKKLVVNRP